MAPTLETLPTEILDAIAVQGGLKVAVSMSQLSTVLRRLVYNPSTFSTIIAHNISSRPEIYGTRKWSLKIQHASAKQDMLAWRRLLDMTEQISSIFERAQTAEDIDLAALDAWQGEIVLLEHPILDASVWPPYLGEKHKLQAPSAQLHGLDNDYCPWNGMMFAATISTLKALESYGTFSASSRHAFKRRWRHHDIVSPGTEDPAFANWLNPGGFTYSALTDTLNTYHGGAWPGNPLGPQSDSLDYLPQLEDLRFDLTISWPPTHNTMPPRSIANLFGSKGNWAVWHPCFEDSMLDTDMFFGTEWQGSTLFQQGIWQYFGNGIKFVRNDDQLDDKLYAHYRLYKQNVLGYSSREEPLERSGIRFSVSFNDLYYCKTQYQGVTDRSWNRPGISGSRDYDIYMRGMETSGEIHEYRCRLTTLGIIGVTGEVDEHGVYTNIASIWLWRQREAKGSVS